MGRKFRPETLEYYMDFPRAIKYSIGTTKNIAEHFSKMSGMQGEIFCPQRPGWRQKEFVNNMNPRIGAFFELLSNQIFGGTLLGLKFMSGMDGFRPDIVDYSKKIVREVTACKWGDSIKLTDHKIGKYALIRGYKHFLPHNFKESSPNFQIFFDCFKYYLTNPRDFFMSKTGDKVELFNMVFDTLSQETAFLLSIPFSVIWEIHGKSRRSEINGYDPLSRFSPVLMQKLITAPHETLESELGLNLDDYKIKQTRIPRTMEICGRKLRPFPILSVKHRSMQRHDRWVSEFIETNRRYLEEQRERTRDELRNNVEAVKREQRAEGSSDISDEEATGIAIQEDLLHALLEKGEMLVSDEDSLEGRVGDTPF